jgi:hypothetical protein
MNQNQHERNDYQRRQTASLFVQRPLRESSSTSHFDGSLRGSCARRMCFLLITGCVLLLPSNCRAATQASFVFPSSVAVGSTAAPQAVNITIQATGTLASIRVLTQGSANLDFTPSGVGTCTGSYVQGQTCSVSVSFAPRYPGLRVGAIVLVDNNGHFMADQSLSGMGTGSLSVMAPGEINTLAGDGCLNDGSCPTSGGTPATSSALNLPLGEATDAAGNLYISDTGNNRIQKVDPVGNVITIAGGTEIAGFSGDGGPAMSAQINVPSAIAIDGAGNIFFADTGNNAIREIRADTGNISTIAGTLGSAGFSGDGHAATLAQLSAPQGFAFDASGDLYIADTGNHRIREVPSSGNITTVAGSGSSGFSGDGGVALSGQFNLPWGICVATDNNLYIADFGNNRIRRIDAVSGNLSTVAGNGTGSYTGDGGLALNATLNGPASVAIDAADNLYIADSENNAIRKVNHATGAIATLAGNGTALFGGDGFNAPLAGLYKPYSVYLDAAGDLFLADRLDLRIREVSATVAGLQYPTMKEGKTSAPIAQKIENDGNASLNLTNLAALPATTHAALDFTPTDPITTTCSTSQSLAVDSSCVLAVEFTPVTVGTPGTGVLSVTSDSGNSPVAVDISGTVLSVDPSSTTVTSNLNPAAVGLAVTFTAHIASPNQVTGTVQFFDGTAAIGIPQSVTPSSDTATITTSFSVLQSHSITAVYSGDNLNAASTPNTALIEIIEQATHLNVIPTANPAVEFAPLTFNAAVTGWTTAPTGSITFTDGTTPIGSAPLNGNGVASLQVPPLAVGKHNITAVFAGDANDFTSQYSFVQTVDLAPSSTTLNTSNAVAQFATPITFTATVSGVSSSTPTGNVAIKDGAITLATVPLNTLGIATYINSTLTAGTHKITVVYLGDADYATSTSTQIITETISQTATSTMLSANTTDSISGRPVVLTATVREASGGNTPTGTVNFMNGNILLGTSLLNNGTASLTVSNLGIGTDNITAIYSGDSNDTTSKSPSLAITILQAPTTTTLTSSQSPLPTLASVVITATVSNGGINRPTGLVTFSEDSVSIGVGTLNSDGVATISIPSLTAGSHTFVASYAGDPLDISSISSPFTELVQLRPTTDTLTTSATSLTGGQQLTLISVIRSTGSSASTAPTGNVSFMSGSITLASVPVDATGVATVTVLLSGTTATISSIYNGNANYGASSSSPTPVTIGPPPDFDIQATPTSWQMQSKQNRTLKLTLTSVKSFADTFSLGCLGLPKNATCTFSQDETNLAAGGVQSIDVTVDTGSPLLSGTQARNNNHAASTAVFACLLPGCIVFGLLGSQTRRFRSISMVLLLMGLFGLTSGLSGCGSIQNNGTPPGTYNFMINASSQTGISHFVSVTMTITQ